jgi:hypothetical protein
LSKENSIGCDTCWKSVASERSSFSVPYSSLGTLGLRKHQDVSGCFPVEGRSMSSEAAPGVYSGALHR